MFSIPDMALLGAAALLLFGPEQLPRVARRAGNVMREIQNTSQSFIREMERAADIQDEAVHKPSDPGAAYDPLPYEPVPYDDAPTMAMHAIEPPAPDPAPPDAVGEKLAEPRPALDLGGAEALPAAAAPPPGALKHVFGEPAEAPEPPHAGTNGAANGSPAAEPAPEPDHAPHL
ncbi:MAG TPA: twin-arginine translocase TatA/TatE family subunit [Candidatus Elarobacter sp.]|jgi:sec-independent protein translocase protein TatA